MKPDICTSISCESFGCDYCRECSHAIFLGEGKDRNGKFWKFEFNQRLGVTFLRKDDEPMLRQPSEKSPAWDVFNEWKKEFDKT